MGQYYRMAVKQGGEAFGLSWIYKVRPRVTVHIRPTDDPLRSAEVHGRLMEGGRGLSWPGWP